MRPDLRLEEKTRIHPEKAAIIFGREIVSYGELWHRVTRLADGLAAEGLAAGERIACISTNHPAFLEIYFASSLLGALFVPLNFRLSPPELSLQIRDTQPSILVLGPNHTHLQETLAESIREVSGKIFCVEGDREGEARSRALPYSDEAIQGDLIARTFSPEDPHLIMFTSGATGIPKGPVLPYRKTLFNSLNAKVFFQLSPDDRVVVPVPLFHSLGLNILSVPVFFEGGTVILMDRFDPPATLLAIQEHRATFLGAVPTIYKRLLEHGLEPYDLSSLRFCFTAGAPIPVPLIERYHERGILMKQGFGQTETSILCCLDAEDAIRKAGSVGKPVIHAEIRVVNERMEDVGPGNVGEIVARGPIVMTGYWNRPKESAQAFHGPWLRTMDLAQRDDEGFITLVGRKNDMYISGGENIHPEEVEAVYRYHPDIEEIAVIGIPDPDLGQAVTAFLLLRKGAELNEADLRAFAQGKLAGYKIPHRFVRVDSLPRTETGKIQRFLLRECFIETGE